jgi:serine/threonine protein kinase
MPPLSIWDYEFHERLGKGASGVVYRAVRRKDERQVAVKQIDLGDMEAEVRVVTILFLAVAL